MTELSILVHTFSGYSRLWPGLVESIRPHCQRNPLIDQHIYFGSDIEHKSDVYFQFPALLIESSLIYSGPGEWSNRLMKLLDQIPTEYILYLQEDHWPNSLMPDLFKMVTTMEVYELNRLQLSPINQFYSLTGSELPLFFHPTSKYLVSHQPSIWRKDFLLSCLEPGETPWQNEYEGTKRLQKRNIQGKIAIYPYDWYSHKCIKGQIQE